MKQKSADNVKFVIIALLMICVQTTNGQWVPTGGPTRGGYVADLCVLGSYIFICDGKNGVFRSTDNGASWKAIASGLTNKYIQCLAVKNNIIYAGGYNRTDAEGFLFISSDSGITWKSISSGIPEDLYSIFIRAIGFHESNILIATDNHVLRSADNGTSWIRADSGFESFPNVFVESKGLIFTGTSKGVYRSFDGGVSWATHYEINDEVWAMAALGNKILAGAYHAGLYISSDSGASWKRKILDSNLTAIKSFAISGDTVFAAGEHEIFVSYDSASSWITINTEEIECSNFTSFDLIGNILFVGTYQGVYKSTNCDTDWSTANFELANLNISNLFSKGDTIFTTDQPEGGLGLPQLYRSTDNGKGWTVINTFNSRISSLYVRGDDIFVGCRDTIYHSPDNGTTWSIIGAGIQATSIAAIENTVLAGTENNGIYRSTDDGNTWWISENSSLVNTSIRSLAVSEGNIFASTAQGIFRSSDNGKRWTSVSSGSSDIYAKYLAVDGNTIVAGTTGYSVYISTDNGQNWTTVTDSSFTSIVSLAIKNDIIFVGTFKDVYQLIHDGSVWRATRTGLVTNMNIQWVSSLTVNETDVFAGTKGASILRRPLSDFPVAIKASGYSIKVQNDFKIVLSGAAGPNATISFFLPRRELVAVSVYNLSGSLVQLITNRYFDPGTQTISWDTQSLSAGSYLVKVKSPAITCAKLFAQCR